LLADILSNVVHSDTTGVVSAQDLAVPQFTLNDVAIISFAGLETLPPAHQNLFHRSSLEYLKRSRSARSSITACDWLLNNDMARSSSSTVKIQCSIWACAAR